MNAPADLSCWGGGYRRVAFVRFWFQDSHLFEHAGEVRDRPFVYRQLLRSCTIFGRFRPVRIVRKRGIIPH